MKTIDVAELNQKLKNGEKLHLVDVRETFEHDEFNIGGILLPLGEIRMGDTEKIDHLKDEEVFLYCRSGNRSGQAALILETMGFSNCTNVVGGMLAWQENFGV
ncbi:MAG: rhodanese-like domain-containing protein [Chitinophagaceae bacterium]|jgi:rhodanese-related sulfurtransferase